MKRVTEAVRLGFKPVRHKCGSDNCHIHQVFKPWTTRVRWWLCLSCDTVFECVRRRKP